MNTQAAKPDSHPPTTAKTSGNQILASVSEFLGRYLSCTQHQRTLLALWVVHSYCFRATPVTPYLNVHSCEKQSGKTLCLELLRLLCAAPFHVTGVSPAAVIQQFKNQKFKEAKGDPGITVLLDDCHLTFGSSSQTRALQAVLLAGGRRNGSYSHLQSTAVDPMQPYAPKAFAGSAALPSALADLSIPIALVPKPSGSRIRRFRLEEAFGLAQPLRQAIEQWRNENLQSLAKHAATPYPQDQFPSELSARQQDCVEPLLLLADLVGDDWPSQVRRALVNVFIAQELEGHAGSLQLLFDIREVFLGNMNRDRISTEDILNALHSLDDSNWNDWDDKGPLTPRSLASLLRPFYVGSRTLRISSNCRAKGFCRDDFESAWKRYLPPPHPGLSASAEAGPPNPDPQDCSRDPGPQDTRPDQRKAVHPTLSLPVTDQTSVPQPSSVPQIANKNALCHDVTDKSSNF